jgi:glycosyltransferase involved in cell wall biosynthesis
LRIGIDALGLQSPHSRGRGIGRFGRGLVAALAEVAGPQHELILYAYPGLDRADLPASERLAVRELADTPLSGQAIEAVVRDDPDALDVLLVPSPLEMYGHYDPPPRPTTGRMRLVAVMHDVIPFLFQEQYLTWAPSARRFYRNLERLRGYDLLLTNSAATCDDTARLLGLPESRTAVIDGAADTAFFRPLGSGESSAAALSGLGLDEDRPFVFCLASTDRRKNVAGLFDAFARLDPRVRDAHRLVVACALESHDAAELRGWAEARGIAAHLVLTGEVSDEVLRACYQRCAAFAFPSRYEGFGLPILEAMACGAPVLAGDNSSQSEVAGDAAELVRADEPGAIAEGLTRILTNPFRAAELRAAGPLRAAQFSWTRTAGRAVQAIEGLAAPRRRLRVASDERPPLAVLSPLPRQFSGISRYTLELLAELERYFPIDLYHDESVAPDLGALSPRFSCVGHRQFARRDRIRPYVQILGQMGNSHLHGAIYDRVLAHGGVITLHDLYLGGFHWWRAQQGLTPPVDASVFADYFRDQIRRDEPGRGSEVGHAVLPHLCDPDALQRRLREAELALHRSLVEAADAVIVHSHWARARIVRALPGAARRVHVIPMGADPAPVADAAGRLATRRAHSLPMTSQIVACFGILHSQKMNVEAIDAFAAVASKHPEALLVLAGPEQDGGAARRRARMLGLEPGRVRFLGYVGDAEFNALMGAVDVGINLRRAPTYGESSAALMHLLRHGVPTVIHAVDALAEVPESAACRVEASGAGPGLTDRLAAALDRLLSDAPLRAKLSEGARSWVEAECRWSVVAQRYARILLETPRRTERAGAWRCA